MNATKHERRIKALAEQSSYVENVLTHALVAELASVQWQRDPLSPLQIFNAEVDNLGYDLVLTLGSQSRYVQLKQAHEEKVPVHCSIRLSFSNLPGSCVILMSHSIASLQLRAFRFFGANPGEAMPLIGDFGITRAPGRRTADGKQKVRPNYRDVPVRSFKGPLSSTQLFDLLFPGPVAAAENS